ncbi:hypothetical protein BH11CYA1_BH11CYA1_17410 [soil metagenome]
MEKAKNIQGKNESAKHAVLPARPLSFVIAIKRAAATIIDFVAIGALTMSPYLMVAFLNLTNHAPEKGFINDLSNPIYGFCLASTPIPLIYLRTMFHKRMHVPTPGEFLVGIATRTNKNGAEGNVHEAIYAVVQYLGLLMSGMLVLLFILITTANNGLNHLCYWDDLVQYSAWGLISLSLLSFAYLPNSQIGYQSFIDDLCKISVDRLR